MVYIYHGIRIPKEILDGLRSPNGTKVCERYIRGYRDTRNTDGIHNSCEWNEFKRVRAGTAGTLHVIT